MEQLADHIFGTYLRSNKRQPNQVSIHNHILKTMESLAQGWTNLP